MRNIEEFNIAVAEIFGLCYREFPTPVPIYKSDIGASIKDVLKLWILILVKNISIRKKNTKFLLRNRFLFDFQSIIRKNFFFVHKNYFFSVF